MANIWLFPYRVAQLGGAAFLIPYLIFVALLGFVLLFVPGLRVFDMMQARAWGAADVDRGLGKRAQWAPAVGGCAPAT